MDVDYAKAVEMVVKAKDAKPEGYRYSRPEGVSSCQYYHTDAEGAKTPGCLIGTAFLAEGICTFETFDAEFEEFGSYTLNSVGSDALIERLQEETEHRFTEKAIYFLSNVQGRQDCDNTWEEAISKAIMSIDAMNLSDSFE